MDTIVTPVTVITLDSTRIVHSIKADLVARYFPPVVRLVQYDQSLPVIAVSLMQNGQAYTLPSGAAANIRVHKPDATYVYNPALGCDSTRKVVYFEVTQAMAAASGDGLAIIEIVVDGDIAGTSLITLHFEENPVPEDAIESSDEWETIYELGERIIASTVTPVSTAAGMTDHDVVYLYTGTESGWNQGHMYYYNGTTWVDAGIAVTDTTLSVAGLAADAKKTGDEIADLNDGFTASRKYTNKSIDYVKDSFFPIDFDVENGEIDGDTGADINPPAVKRLRTVGYIDGDVAFMTMNTSLKPYRYRIFYYDANKAYMGASNYASANYEDAVNPNNYPYIRLMFFDYSNNSWNNPVSPLAVSNFGLYKKINAFISADDSRMDDLPYYAFITNKVTITNVQNSDKTFKDGLRIAFNQITATSTGKTWETLTMRIFNPVSGEKVHFHYEKTPSTYRTVRINYYANGTLTEGDAVSDSNDAYLVLPNRNDIEYVDIVIYLSNGTAGTLGATYTLGNIVFETYHDGILEQYPPYFMKDILANLKYHGDSYNGDNSLTPLVLAHFSDVHASAPALDRLKTFQDTYGEYIDDVIHTGDAVKTVWENGFTFWDNSNAEGFLNVIGNHDCWTWGDNYTKAYTRAYSAKQCYERYIAPYVSGWDVTYTSNKCYYYKDYADSNIRLIVIDNMHWRETVTLSDNTTAYVYKDGQPTDTGQQKTWLEGVLADALENELSVICATHYPAIRTPINSTFMSLNAYSVGELQTEIIQTIQNFIDGGGEFITWICGHNHEDLFGTIANFPDQLMIAITDSQIGLTESNVIHLPNTYGETNVNIFSIDPNHKYIRLMRIGSDYDRHGRRIGSIVYDYENMHLIYNG